MAGVGAAPCALDVLEFFQALGVDLRQGYALSENSCAGTVSPSGTRHLGSVGLPLAGVELRLAPDGEVLLRGPAVMAGYRHDPAATREAVDAEGWLHTGDVGTRAPDGTLTIVDRKKEILITAGGKNIAPARVEAELKAAGPLIAHACAVGDRRPYLTALLVLEPEAARAVAGRGDASVAELARDPRVLGAVRAGVGRANERLARVEQVKRFAVLGEEWRPGGAELTPTQKLRRRAVLDAHTAEIEALYG
jgi:long-subunit acyl-CoA synthetase (AMP-forming)